MLSKIKIVLVETSHPGNIGGVARAMKNMSLSRLCLVKPKHFPHADATARASGADDILATAEIYPNLADAIAECSVVIGASARLRSLSWPELTPRACAELCANTTPETQIALIFGRENSGLKNHELDLCQYLLHIPCNQAYSSLNLAAAVQVVCYELFLANTDANINNSSKNSAETLATNAQMELFYEHLQTTITEIGFLQAPKTISMMRRLRRIFNRVQLERKELDILRGILRFSQQHNSK